MSRSVTPIPSLTRVTSIAVTDLIPTAPANSGAAKAITKENLLRTVYTVATAPATHTAGDVAYISNGAAGSPVLAFSNGTNWLRCDTLAAISA